jgi:hypothetical protein
MRISGRTVIGGAIGLLGLVASGSACFADAIDSRLLGAWTTSQTDCKRLFVGGGRGLAYRQPVDKFAQAAIIRPQQILLPASTCQIQHVTREKEVLKLNVLCNDSVSYTNQTVQIRVTSGGEMVYSPTGDPALDTTYVKCAM